MFFDEKGTRNKCFMRCTISSVRAENGDVMHTVIRPFVEYRKNVLRYFALNGILKGRKNKKIYFWSVFKGTWETLKRSLVRRLLVFIRDWFRIAIHWTISKSSRFSFELIFFQAIICIPLILVTNLAIVRAHKRTKWFLKFVNLCTTSTWRFCARFFWIVCKSNNEYSMCHSPPALFNDDLFELLVANVCHIKIGCLKRFENKVESRMSNQGQVGLSCGDQRAT